MRMHVLLLSIIVIGVAAPTEAGLVSITTEDGAGADARVRGGVANDMLNYGGDSFVSVRHGAAGVNQLNNSRKTYLRFDLSSLSDPAVSVELQLTLTNDFTVPVGGVTFQVYGLIDNVVNESWLEGTGTGTLVPGITWANAPANDTGSPNGFTAGATLLGSTTFLGDALNMLYDGETLSFSYASMLSFINADTNNLVTFMLTSQNINTSNNYTFGSNNGSDSDRPTLNITTDPSIAAVPEPSSLALLGFGLVGLVGFARRRNK